MSLKFHVLFLAFALCLCPRENLKAQQLKIRERKIDALGGKAFAASISDSKLSLNQRERLIYQQIKEGNVPRFLRNFKEVTNTENGHSISFYVLPDYLAIGNDTDYCYFPMTPILAQRVANLMKCSLPTKKMVDLIYRNSEIKIVPQPIPPTEAMVTVPIFIAHNEMISAQLKEYSLLHQRSGLTAGHKKDVIISNKIFTEKTPKVVIFGWHQPNGKPIQPLYNRHTHTWADYSHGIRLIQKKVLVDGRTFKINKILADSTLSYLISDEGVITKASYPIFKAY